MTRGIIACSGAALVAAVIVLATRDVSPPSPAPTPAPEPEPAPAPEPTPGPTAQPRGLRHPQQKELVVDGKPHPFLERRYDPELAVRIWPTRDPVRDEASPEAALAGLYSAFTHGDWDWSDAVLDPASRAYAAALDTPRERYLEAWRGEFAGHSFYLTRRIDIPRYVILYTRRDDRPEDAPLSRAPLAFTADPEGRWHMTLALRDHPVYGYDGLRDPHEVRVVSP